MAPTSRSREDPYASVLIVDDDEDLRALLVHALRQGEPCQIEEAASAGEARTRLAQRAFDVVVTDLSMPGEGGLSLMRWSLARHPHASWIVLTGHGTFDTAVEALQLGAFDFLSKPIRSLESLRNAVRNALANQRVLAERDHLHRELQQSNDRLREHVEQVEEACRLLRRQADTIRADLYRAGIIQRALLPDAAPQLDDFHVYALYRPSHSVGGDLYDVARVDDRHVALVIADAAGHGLSAAMLAVLFRSQLAFADRDTRAPREPGEVLRAVNRSLCASLPAPGLFLTAAYCLLDTERREAVIASAGHPALLWVRRGQGVEPIRHTGPALGLDPDADFAEQRIALAPGDGLLFYSDGLYERLPDAADTPAGRIAAALDPHAEPGGKSLERLLAPWRHERADARPPEDDVTVLLLAAAPGASVLDNGSLKPLPTPDVPLADAQTLMGADSRRTTLSVQGLGDWSQSAAFYAECATAIEDGRDVMVDLALCRQLDSTFLGTIHQLCELADRADVEFRMQGVLPAVEELFEELGMTNALDHMVAQMLPLPAQMQPVGAADPDPSARALMLLRAHEGLAALSDRNREEFDPLLAQLRREVGELAR